MKKTLIFTLIALLFGIGIGAGGMYYRLAVYPEKEIGRLVEHQEKQMQKMMRTGVVVAVKSDEIKMKVEKSGNADLNGKELIVKVNKDTIVQDGVKILDAPDLTNYLKQGMKVDVMEKGGVALAVHWET